MDVTDHLAIWQKLEKTDPEHVKAFQRPGGFRGHAIKAVYSERRMTELFGPCGIGWGTNQPDFRLIEAAEEVAVYCTVTVWYRHDEQEGHVVGVGGDMVRKRTKNGFIVDDEAWKKAFTDALTNALKHLGMSADVHMGRYDDDKYIASLRREQAGTDDSSPEQGPPHTAPLDEIPDEPLPPADEKPRRSEAKQKSTEEQARDLWRKISKAQSHDELIEIEVRNGDFIDALPDDIRRPLTQHFEQRLAKLKEATA